LLGIWLQLNVVIFTATNPNIMKTKLTFICLLFFCLLGNAQNIAPGDIVTFSIDIPVTDAEKFYETVSLVNKMNYLEAEYKYKVLDIGNDYVKVIALDFVGDLQPENVEIAGKSFEITRADRYNGIVYKVSLKNFTALATEIQHQELLSVGLLTLPFKARPQGDLSFDTEFNLSSTLNIRLHSWRGTTFNYQLGAGIGSVGLNTSNAALLTDDEAQDVAVLTILNGLMFQYKRVQVGFYAGVDQINNQKNYDWESNGNLWIGFGVGYNLFDLSLSSEKTTQKE
jgi:hypothetical protein